jgi:tetratricopeptide (TPR) repeat protein
MHEPSQEESELWNKVATSDGLIKADALIEISYIRSRDQEYEDSLALCETAKDLYLEKSPESNHRLAHIYYGIGHSLQNLQRSSEAAEALMQSALLLEKIGSEEALHTLNQVGDAWFEAKDYEKSFRAYKRALDSANPEACPAIIARNFVDAGTALEKMKMWDEALKYFTEARSRYKIMKDPRLIAHCDEEISLCYYWLEDGMNALFHAQLALDYAVTAEDSFHITWAKARLALANKKIGNLEIAIKLFNEAKSIMTIKSTPPWKAIIKIEYTIAEILSELGKKSESDEIRRRISNIAEIFEEGDGFGLSIH